MSGRRVTDIVGILDAARGVAIQHVALRRQQFYFYGKTSPLRGLGEGIKQRSVWQTRSTPISRIEMRLLRSSYSTDTKKYLAKGSPVPRPQSVEESESPPEKQGSLEQDHFYERSTHNTTADPLPKSDITVEQEIAKKPPLPDGTIPPLSMDEINGSGIGQTSSELELSAQPSADTIAAAEEARRSQRLSESQIPSREAEGPLNTSFEVDSSDANDSELRIDQDQDVYYSPDSDSTPVFSSLPRVKVPKASASIQKSDEHVADQNINQDVFYSSYPPPGEAPVPDAQAVPEQGEHSEDMYSELFHSPKVARMLQRKSNTKPTGDDISLQRPGEATGDQSKASTSTDYETFAERAVSSTNGRMRSSEDVTQLAADIARDGATTSTQSPTSQGLNSRSVETAYRMQESRVPSSQFSRLWQYGGLATSMAFGAVGEGFRRVTRTGTPDQGSLMLSGANMERLVSKLSRMRGAALKLGQMMSFQDSKMLPPQIHEVLQRVQDSADYMPTWQRNKVLSQNLGSNWRDLFSSFDEIPMAAASIGQVHGAVLGGSETRVAIKVQYPGVSDSIDSDLNNLSILLTASRLLPKGLYLEKTIANARTELAWECDYVREAEAARRFRSLLADEASVYRVPAIIDHASTAQVLTMERMDGIAVTKVKSLTQVQKDWIGTQILRLCLREIIEFRYMQSDPNWTNFLYNARTNQLELLDFGASRDYPAKFIEPYIKILQAAAQDDRQSCCDLSIRLGYLTGHESKAMRDAHVDSILTLAEPFRESSPEIYDFQNQTITDRIRSLIPLMIRERLAPPPEETYSLHRKLSGAFLLCARLGSRINCREMFMNAMQEAKFAKPVDNN